MIHIIDNHLAADCWPLLQSMFADRKRLFVDLFGWDVPAGPGARTFDARSTLSSVRGPEGEHLLVARGDALIRIDIVEGSTSERPVMLRFDLADDARLGARLGALRTLGDDEKNGRPHLRLARRLFALHAIDMRDAGASLRETAAVVIGPGAWPGDGEHRKSRLRRRLIAAGDSMVRAGPVGIMVDRADRAWQSHP